MNDLSKYVTLQEIEKFKTSIVARHNNFYDNFYQRMEDVRTRETSIAKRRAMLGDIARQTNDEQLLKDIKNYLYFIDITRKTYKAIRLDKLMLRRRSNKRSKRSNGGMMVPIYYINGSDPVNHKQLGQVCMYMYLTHKEQIDALGTQNQKFWILCMFLYKFIANHVWNHRSYNPDGQTYEIINPMRQTDIANAVNQTLQRISLGDTSIHGPDDIVMPETTNRKKVNQRQYMIDIISVLTARLGEKPTRAQLLEELRTNHVDDFRTNWEGVNANKYLGKLINKRYKIEDLIKNNNTL